MANEKALIGIPVLVAPQIWEGSWLQRDEFKTYRAAYGYASNQTQAIRALCKLTPEELWYVYEALKSGEAWAAKQPPETETKTKPEAKPKPKRKRRRKKGKKSDPKGTA